MIFTLELSQDLEEELKKEASRLGLPLLEYVLRVFSTGRPKRDVTNGAELVAYWQSEGLIGTRSNVQDSQEHARHLRREAEGRIQK